MTEAEIKREERDRNVAQCYTKLRAKGVKKTKTFAMIRQRYEIESYHTFLTIRKKFNLD